MTIDYRQQLELLKKLQAIDAKLHRLETEQQEIPRQIESAKSLLEIANEEFASLKNNLETINAEYKKLEEEVSYWKNQVKKREAKLYTINNNKEYQAITREVSDVKRANREREEKMLAFMEQIETLTPDMNKAEDLVKQKTEEYNKATEGTDSRLKEIEVEFAEIAKDRPALVSQIDKMQLRKYDFIRKRFPNALVMIQNGICGGCHTRIPPQLYNEMLRFKEFKECPSCRRIVYIEEKQEEAKPEQNINPAV